MIEVNYFNHPSHSHHRGASSGTDDLLNLPPVRLHFRGRRSLKKEVSRTEGEDYESISDLPSPPKKLKATGKKTSACVLARMTSASQMRK